MWFRPRSNQNDNERNSRAQRLRDIHAKNVPIDSDSQERYSVARSQSGRRLSQMLGDDGDKEREKMLRTDHKYKKNRVCKSASRTKIADQLVEKVVPSDKIGMDKSGSSAANVSEPKPRKLSIPSAADAKKTPAKVKSSRPNSNLNLNALLRYKSFIKGSTKKLTSDDFDRMRRKSLSEINKMQRIKSTEAVKETPLPSPPPPPPDNRCKAYLARLPSNDSHDENDNSYDHSDYDDVDYANGNVHRKPQQSLIKPKSRWFDGGQSNLMKKDSICKRRSKG